YKRKNRCVRELEQKQAGRKGQEATVLQDNDAAGPRKWVFRRSVGSVTGPAEMDVGSVDPGQRPEQRDGQRSEDEKDGSGREEIADRSHHPGRRQAAHRSETLIAPESLSEGVMADQTQADRGNPRSKDTAGRPLDYGCSKHGWGIRPQPKDQQRQ